MRSIGAWKLSIRGDTKKKTDESLWITNSVIAKLIFKANETGTILDLSNRNIGDKGTQIIADSLPRCRNITHLFLRNTKITDIGAIRISSILPQTSVISLDISQNEITDIGAGNIINVIKINFFVAIIDTKYLSEHVRVELSECNSIRSEIDTEIARSIEYQELVKSLLPILPTELTLHILDYYNESEHPKARAYLKENLYPKVISWYYVNRSENNSEKEKIIQSFPNQTIKVGQLNAPSVLFTGSINRCLIS